MLADNTALTRDDRENCYQLRNSYFVLSIPWLACLAEPLACLACTTFGQNDSLACHLYLCIEWLWQRHVMTLSWMQANHMYLLM